MKNKNQEKGITLVTLVVTIVVLLIFAGIVIVLGIGSNGLLGRAENAAKVWNEAKKEEENKLDEMFSSIKVAGDSTVTLTMEELDKYIESKVSALSNDEQILSDISSFTMDDKITIYEDRVKVIQGGYKIVEDYVYVNMKLEAQKALNSPGSWMIFQNFPIAEEPTELRATALTPQAYDWPIATIGIINDKICIGNVSPIPNTTTITIKGKYKLLNNNTNE